MTRTSKATELSFDPPGPGFVGARPRAFPAPDDALLPRDASPAFKRSTNDFAHFYGRL